MKHIIFSIFTLLITASCQTKKVNKIKTIKVETKEIQPNIKSIINGDWYETSYIENLKRTKSPYKSQNFLNSIVQLNIDSNNINNGILEIGAPSIHEGSMFVVDFKRELNSNRLQTNIVDYENESNYFELGYTLTKNDTTLIIYKFNENKKVIGQKKFKKVPKNSEGAFQFMVNKTLFQGNYKINDDSEKSLNVKFSHDGIVIGIPNVKKYYILTDFVAGPLNNLDEICFDIDTDKQKCYAYEIKGDTINLYETLENEDHVTLEIGAMKYKMIKK